MHPMYNPSFVQFLTYFNGNKDYFECHEVLEEYWKEIAPRQRKHVLVGLIQLATGMYHWRRGNFKGASTILQKSRHSIIEHTSSPFLEKIDVAQLVEQIEAAEKSIFAKQDFSPFPIAITDSALNKIVLSSIDHLVVLDATFLINKHKLRDRSEVLQERAEAISRRQITSNVEKR
ncbi:hypothetical protein KZO01_10180 [Kurthia zopfii]|uniref:Domain of uncharacterized function (DUF309) n=1 Tax=Kurthia zopfii TaxID=1650 RepID=A0A8B4Q981_9BACL|nr:DUF309 domain-containing protein [Kurthia zopfii]TDR39821.1 hypothetical protein DFR61_11037 [Kurthia zopfii]GEK30709.1 hypothetical protein KZO01_10180 [Kurthia zopfii]STX09270.1 Domain of uncharacterised function (DUF309) [Kurthia zopfii]